MTPAIKQLQELVESFLDDSFWNRDDSHEAVNILLTAIRKHLAELKAADLGEVEWHSYVDYPVTPWRKDEDGEWTLPFDKLDGKRGRLVFFPEV